MSPKKDKNVAELVEKYKSKYSTLDRDLLRKIIRLENPLLFSEGKTPYYLSNLRKLDRHMRKTYKINKPIGNVDDIIQRNRDALEQVKGVVADLESGKWKLMSKERYDLLVSEALGKP
jgi:hypothetical protein